MRRRRAAAVFCGIAALALLLTLATPLFRGRASVLEDGKALAKSLDDGGWGSGVTYPFIRFTKKGWVLSDPTPYETITICEIATRRFRCLSKEKEAHAAELADIARELSFVPR